ncbi:MAG: phage major capsid protein [Proteobacteria bacterium]|nr:phage major capsid protein [Pseudomonadota bacterium]
MTDISQYMRPVPAPIIPPPVVALKTMPWDQPRPDPGCAVSAPKMISGHGQFHTNEPAAKIRKPYNGIDLAGIRLLVDSPQRVEKELAQWLIPSTLMTRTFAKQEADGQFLMLWADLDAEPTPIIEVDAILRQLIIPDCNFELYTSRSAREDLQKARILIPLTKPLSGANWMLCQELLGDKLAAAGIAPDRAAQRPAQLCYLPNRGAFYDSRSAREGNSFDPMEAWSVEIAVKQKAMAAAAATLQCEAKAAAVRREALKLTDSPDTIGAFNRAYTVQEILQRANYAQRGNTFRHPHSESGSFSANIKEGRVHSLSSSDPLYTGGGGIGAHDAFSAFCVLWAGGDVKVALTLAGDDWLSIDGESWNKAKQREYMQQKHGGDGLNGVDAEAGNSGHGGEIESDDAAGYPPVMLDHRAYPPPFRGVMHDVVQATLAVSIKPQPDLCTLSALIGMASACNGIYSLPSGMRLNLYGCGVAGTGDGKDRPRSIAVAINKMAHGRHIGKPASGPGLEDCMVSYTGALIALDEIAHFFGAINNGKAPPHLIELAGLLLQFFSVSSNHYTTRVRAVSKDTIPLVRLWSTGGCAASGSLIEVALKAGSPLSGRMSANLDGGIVHEGTATVEKPSQFFDVKSKRAIPVLTHAHSLASLEKKTDTPTVGRLLRGIVLGGRADDANELADERKALGINSDPSGGYTVAGMLSSEWIDSLRAMMVLNRAGCRTIPMDTGSLALARVVDDPTISWHGENDALGTGDPTFGAINLHAKTCVCLVRLSLELSQDSANIEQILSSTINSAMASAIDRAGLVGVTVDAGAAPAGVMNLANRNTVTSIGAPTSWDFLVDGMYELLADNVPADRIGAFIAHPAVWKKMAKLKTGISSDKSPLPMPAEVAAIPKLWTTAAPLDSGTTAKGIIADWRDLIMGVRKDINVRILSEAFLGSNLQVAVLAYARVDFAATRQQSFCTLEGITV